MYKSSVLLNLAAITIAGLLAGCAPIPVPYHPQGFDSNRFYEHSYATSPARTCEAARRALLSQGYTMDDVQPGKIAIAGHKYFQADPTHHVALKFSAECDARGKDATGGTTVFASGEEDQYGLQRGASASASLNVSPFGSLSMPLPSGIDQMVEMASETVTDPAWYQGVFDLTHEFLASGEIPENPIPLAAAPASQAASAVASAPLSPQSVLPAPEQSLSATRPAASAPEQSPSATLPAASAPEQSASAALPTASTPEQNPFGTLPAALASKQSASAALPAASEPEQSPSGTLPAASAPKQN
jgi:hypothetical protein